MIGQLAHLNWISVGLAFAAYFVLGYVWYKVLFEKQYKISLGKENETLPEKPIYIVGPSFCVAVITIVSAVLIRALHIDSFGGALEFAGLIGTGFLVSNTVNIAINPNIPKPIFYGCITGGYHLVGFTIANCILVAMK